MQPTTIIPAISYNWYDAVVLVALLYGLWSGIRTGLAGEILRVLGLLLSVLVALNGYRSAGAWLRTRAGLAEEPANLGAFIGLAVIVALLALIARQIIRRSTRRLVFPAAVENIGGGLAGVLRMLVVMAWLTVILALTRSPFWHRHVARESQFGLLIVRQFPAVAAVTQKQFPEEFLFFRDLHRPDEPSIEAEPKPK